MRLPGRHLACIISMSLFTAAMTVFVGIMFAEDGTTTSVTVRCPLIKDRWWEAPPQPPGLGWQFQFPAWYRHPDWAVVQDMRRQIHELEARVKILEGAAQPNWPDGVQRQPDGSLRFRDGSGNGYIVR